MDWRLALEAEQAALQRIVALLFALADLAERAGSRSRAVRGFVPWLLFRAEAVAQGLVTCTHAPICRTGNGSADAMRLAQNFRDLARELDRQSALAFAVDDAGAGDSLLFRGETAAVHTSRGRKGKLSPGVALAPHPAPDTS